MSSRLAPKILKNFDAVSRVLVDHYSGVHLREGKTLGGSSAASRSNFRYTGKGSRPKGKSKEFTRRTYPAVEEGDEEDEDSWWEDSWEGYQLEAYPAASYDEDDGDDPELVPHEDQAIALNSIEELDDTADAGHAIQLQLAANAAFGKAKGKGKRPKGKGKGKGKVARSHLTLEQRRDKLKALKAKSKCLRCGGTGHWAGDPECKFPNGNTGGGGKPRAHVAIIQGSSADGLHVAAAAGSHTSFVVNERQPLPPHPLDIPEGTYQPRTKPTGP